VEYRSTVRLKRLIADAAQAEEKGAHPKEDAGARTAKIPFAWANLASARLGDTEQVKWLQQLCPAPAESPDAAIAAAAAKVEGFSADWPWGPRALAATVMDETTLLGQWRGICLDPDEVEAGAVAHVDATMLCNGLGVITGEVRASPITVLDLAHLINTMCVHERICYLENDNIGRRDLKSVFDEKGENGIFVELPVAATADGGDYAALGDVRESLRGLYKGRTVPWINDLRHRKVGTTRQQQAWLSAWTTILGRQCAAKWLLRCPDEGKSTEYHDIWNSDTKGLLRDIVDVDKDALTFADHQAMRGKQATHRNDRDKLAQASTTRALFNIHVAELLGVPYAASLARVPVLRLIADDSHRAIADLTRVAPAAEALQQVFGETAIKAMRSRPTVTALLADHSATSGAPG
jgi:hypothetical protein